MADQPTPTPTPLDASSLDAFLRYELTHVRSELAALRTDLSTGYLSRGEWLAERNAFTQRIRELEEWQTWAARIVLALVITAVIASLALNTAGVA